MTNHWELYASMDGWQEVSNRLDMALTEAIRSLDEAVARGSTIREAVSEAFLEVERTMVLPENSRFGSGDSESYHHLSTSLTRHIQTRWGLSREVRIDRHGDVEGIDAPRFGQ